VAAPGTTTRTQSLPVKMHIPAATTYVGKEAANGETLFPALSIFRIWWRRGLPLSDRPHTFTEPTFIEQE
jgi:hypothetical protein